MEFVNNQSIKIHYDGSGKRIRSHQMKASYVSASIEGFDTIYREAYNRHSAANLGINYLIESTE